MVVYTVFAVFNFSIYVVAIKPTVCYWMFLFGVLCSGGSSIRATASGTTHLSDLHLVPSLMTVSHNTPSMDPILGLGVGNQNTKTCRLS